MTREELIADVDKAVADFATQLAGQGPTTTGLPKPPIVEVTESQFDPSKTNLQIPSADRIGPPPEDGGGPGGGGFVYGACCEDTACSIKTEGECFSAGGDWQGGGVDCSPNPCDGTCGHGGGPCPTGVGACCISDPSGTMCSILSALDCDAVGGRYQGDDTFCAPSPCVCATPPCPEDCSACPGPEGQTQCCHELCCFASWQCCFKTDGTAFCCDFAHCCFPEGCGIC